MAATTEALSDTDVAMAYLPPGWIGQNLFGYVMPMVVGYCVCCPNPPTPCSPTCARSGPTYFLATPRVLEALLTQVSLRIEDAGGFNRASLSALHRAGAARRLRACWPASPVAIGDRLAHAAGDLLICGPLRDVLGMSRVSVAYAAGDAIAPDLLLVFPRPRASI